MLIRETDRKLDMECVLAFPLQSAMFGLAARNTGLTPARIYSYSDRTFLQIYFWKNSTPSSLISILKGDSSVEERAGYFSITEDITGKDNEDTILRIMDVPSVVISESHLSGNDLTMTLRFHSSSLPVLNELISNLKNDESGPRLAMMGPTEGLVQIINRIHSSIPLSVVRFTISVPEAPLANRFSDYDSLVSEADVRRMRAGGTKVIFYSREELPAFKPLSPGEYMYETTIGTNFLDGLRMNAFEAKIPLVGFFGRISRDSLEITTFLPSTEVYDFLNMFYSTMRDMKENSSLLELCAPFSEDFWEWI